MVLFIFPCSGFISFSRFYGQTPFKAHAGFVSFSRCLRSNSFQSLSWFYFIFLTFYFVYLLVLFFQILCPNSHSKFLLVLFIFWILYVFNLLLYCSSYNVYCNISLKSYVCINWGECFILHVQYAYTTCILNVLLFEVISTMEYRHV